MLTAASPKGCKPKGCKPKGDAKPKPSADQLLKDAASTAKAKASQAAGKKEELAARLEQQLAGIDERLAADRRALACMVVTLPWPDRKTVVKQSRPPTAAEVEESTSAKLRSRSTRSATQKFKWHKKNFDLRYVALS